MTHNYNLRSNKHVQMVDPAPNEIQGPYLTLGDLDERITDLIRRELTDEQNIPHRIDDNHHELQQQNEHLQRLARQLRHKMDEGALNMSVAKFIPEHFLGRTGDNPTIWLRKFNKYCEYHNFDNARKFRAVPMFLKQNAESWYDNLDAGHRPNNFDEFSTALIAHFNNNSSQYLHEQLFAQRKQQSNESVDTFAFAIRSLGEHAQKNDNEIKVAFINGLLPALRPLVIISNPDTFDVAIAKAHLAESSQLSNASPIDSQLKDRLDVMENMLTSVINKAIHDDNSNQNIDSPPPRPLNDRFRYQRQQPPTPFHRGQMNFFNRPPEARNFDQRNYQQNSRRYPTPPQDARQSGPGYHYQFNTNSIVCHYCSKPGHFVSRCFKKQRDLQNQRYTGPLN